MGETFKVEVSLSHGAETFEIEVKPYRDPQALALREATKKDLKYIEEHQGNFSMYASTPMSEWDKPIILSEIDFKAVMAFLENPPPPNEELIKLLSEEFKEHGSVD